jgi:voltage-gated sodium channel type II alpha
VKKKRGKLSQKTRMIMNAQKFANAHRAEISGTPNGKQKLIRSQSRNEGDADTYSMKSYKSQANMSSKTNEVEMSEEESTMKKSQTKDDVDSIYEADVDAKSDGGMDQDHEDGEDGDQMIPDDQRSKIHEEEEYPADCFPPPFYEKFPIFNVEGTPFGMGWDALRLKTFRLIENKYFETAVIIMILLSSLALALEDVHLPNNPVLIDILYYMDRIFTVIFLLEMMVKWLALGFRTYFTNAWCWLDFVIVMVSQCINSCRKNLT